VTSREDLVLLLQVLGCWCICLYVVGDQFLGWLLQLLCSMLTGIHAIFVKLL
jgi:hypothetical protein